VVTFAEFGEKPSKKRLSFDASENRQAKSDNVMMLVLAKKKIRRYVLKTSLLATLVDNALKAFNAKHLG
jgi:hypothetical protein